ncbi:MAG: HAMP domain-containing protein [Ignavibacteriales bacterium]|nr:HAMP domain-containing protein [Ignavibacteriales bacterium]
MRKKIKKFSNKLILFVFISSFILIIGSFLYFYFYGISYINNTANKELKAYKNLFDKASFNEFNKFDLLLEGFLINLKLNELSIEDVNKELFYILEKNDLIIEEVYFFNKVNNNGLNCSLVKVFGGEIIFNKNKLEKVTIQNLINAIKTTLTIDRNKYFGINSKSNFNDFYFIRKSENINVILKINLRAIFSKIISQVYHSPNIQFHMVNDNNIIMYSTNKTWVNQNADKFINKSSKSENNVYIWKDDLIYNSRYNEYFYSNFILTLNLSYLYDEFNTIIIRLFTYSLFIYLLIVTITYLYSKKISSQFGEIADVTKSIGEGNFDSKINIQRNDELGLLIDSFNDMVDKLKENYKKLNLTNKKLELKIDELVKTKAELTKQQKLALIGETVSKISHEIQNKISAVSVWVQNLEMQSSQDETTKIYVNEIKMSLNSFLEMLLNFKKFYRKPYLEKSKIELSNLIEKVISNYSYDIKAKNIIVEKKLKCSETILLDAILFEEVISNLLVNAIYFNPKKGKIKIITDLINDTVFFQIANEGEQIKEENLENIFNPFFTTKSSGSGLGLAITKNIIEAHEGTIEASNTTIGVSFTINLPIKKDNEDNENISN